LQKKVSHLLTPSLYSIITVFSYCLYVTWKGTFLVW
jgi:hypothetical protein